MKQKFYIISYKEIEREGSIIWSSEVHHKLYTSQESARRAIPHLSGASGSDISWNDSKTVAEVSDGSKYYTEYTISPVHE